MRTRKEELISDNLKPLVTKIMKDNRKKYHYSLEDLSKAISHKKNRQTLHKYENGNLNIPYDILLEICRVFNVDTSMFELGDIATKEEQNKLEKKIVKEYMSSINTNKGLSFKEEKIINQYKNAFYEPVTNHSELGIKISDDSMIPTYIKNDKVFFEKKEEYVNGDDIVIAIKNNTLAIRRLYKYPKGLILQALNPKYQTININIISNEMILGKVTSIYREIN